MITEVEGKIPNTSGLATNSSLNAVENKIRDITSLITKTDFDAKLKYVSDRVTNNKSKDLLFDNELKKSKTLAGSTAKTKFDEVQRENSFTRGFYYYHQQSYLVYECKAFSFKKGNNDKLTTRKSTGIDNLSINSNLKAIPNTQGLLPILENNGWMNLKFNGNYFEQNKVLHPSTSNVVNIYVVYKLDPISLTRNADYTIQNTLFGTVKITKNTNISKNKYEGYGICFDEGGEFSHMVKKGNFDHTTLARNVLIFCADMNFNSHANNKANNIYVMGKDFIQGINNTTLYAEIEFHNNFKELRVEFILSLHYNGDNSYLFVNGYQELKFNTKNDQILKEKLCLENLSNNWTTKNLAKTRMYGRIYDFAVDYEAINGVKQIYDMHRYLMTKHNI